MPVEAKRTSDAPNAGVTGSCELLIMDSGKQMRVLSTEQYVHITIEPLLQPFINVLIMKTIGISKYLHIFRLP